MIGPGDIITGTVRIEDCTFNIMGTYANESVIDIRNWSSITRLEIIVYSVVLVRIVL